MKLLGLIQKWGLNFEDKKSALPNFYSVYNKLRNSNVQFPNDFESSYQIYLSNTNSSSNYNKNNYDDRNDEYENENSDKDDGETFYYMESLKNKLKVPNFEHKYRRLVNFLVKMHENIQMANLLIDSRERSGLKDIINTLREGNNTLIDTISGGRLKDEKLMEITLGTTEDINQTLNRDEDVKNGYKPKKFTSYFVLNNVIPIRNSNNYRTRAKSTKPKKSIQRRDERYKNYDMDLNEYDKNKYKEKMGGGPKNADDIFDLFSASNPSNEPGYNQPQNNQPINNFFPSQNQMRGNNNNQYPELRNNPMNNIFNNNNRNPNNINTISFNNNNSNFQGNNMNNNNFRTQYNQNNNQRRPVMTNFDILEQKLNNLNVEQNNNFNFNSQSTQFNPGFNNINRSNNNNNNNNNLMSMLDQLGPSPQDNSNQLVPYIGGFNQNNNNNQFNNFNNNNQFNNGNISNNQFNNFNNSNNNFNNNNQNINFNNNNQNNFNNNTPNNFNNNNPNPNNNFNMSNNFNNNNNQFNNFNNSNNQNNNFGNDNNGNMFNFDNNNNQMGMSQNMNNNNFGMGQNNNQQMSLEEMEKQQKLKELDDLF